MMPKWPKEKLLKHGPELSIDERIRRYQHNIRTIHAAGCTVPSSAYKDTLDAVEIEMWFADKAFNLDRLTGLIRRVAELTDATIVFPPAASLSIIAKGCAE